MHSEATKAHPGTPLRKKGGLEESFPVSLSSFDRKAATVLGVLLIAFLVLQCLLPLGTAVKIGADEDFMLSLHPLSLQGYKLYTQIWDDQPPLYSFLLTEVLKHASPPILYARLLTVGFSMLLLCSVYILAFRLHGLLVAAVATGLVIASPGFIELSCSCMQEIPALAPVMAAMALLWAGPESKWRIKEMLAGVLFAVALQMKFIGIIYLPLLVLILWQNRQSAAAPIKSFTSALLLLGLSAAIGFVVVNYLTGNPLLIQLRQSWESHFASGKSFEYGSAKEHSYDWSVLIKNWDTSLPALLGIVLLWRQFPRVRAATLPVAWLALTLVVFSLHKPWWAYYYVHNALPLCWCAAVAIGGAWHYARQKGRWQRLIPLGAVALSALCWVGGRIYLQEDGIRSSPRLYNCLVLKEIERFKPLTTFLFTDQPIYSFHSGIPVPPHLAMLSLKRMWTGDMSNARLAAELETAAPGIILWGNDTREVPFQELLNRQYRLVYEDSSSRLFVHKTIVTQAHY